MSGFEELSIGAFARRVGLTPSALRFYDDCGLLRPRRVDAASGYRYYGPEQEPRGRMLRDLRRAGLPLPEARTVLDGPPSRSRAILERHLRRTREAARTTAAAVDDVLRTLPDASGPPVTVRVGGPELSAAIRQVSPATLTGPAPAVAASAAPPVAAGDVDGAVGVLRGLLFEVVDGELRVVATDRYRLSVRVLHPCEPAYGTGRVVVDAAAARRLASWSARATDAVLELTPTALLAHDPAAPEEAGPSLEALDGRYPDYALVLDGLAPTRTRLITGRTALREALATHHEAPHITLTTRPPDLDGETDVLRVEAPGRAGVPVPVVRTGEVAGLAFDPAVLAAAVDTGVGPDVVLEIAGPCAPVVVRSADQGTFTTLAMPVSGGG